jgi:hypothetical protein
MRTDYSPHETSGGRWLLIARNSFAVLVAEIGSHHGRGPWANACGWACSVMRQGDNMGNAIELQKPTMQAVETLELKLTDEQIAAIRQRIARRKRQIKECGKIDLGEINERGDFKSVAAKVDQPKRPDADSAISTT